MRTLRAAACLALMFLSMPANVCVAAPAAVVAANPSDEPAAARFAALALECLHEEYPNHISHTLDSDAGATSRQLTPAFYGCYDWHSDVHGHWLLVRLLRLFPEAPFAAQARNAVAQSLTTENIAGEVTYLRRAGRASFERPYGLAWLLRLAAELREWPDPQAQEWSDTLRPLEGEAAARLKSWLPKLHYPIRTGEHDQTAFSFGLVWDWAGVAGDAQMRGLLEEAAGGFICATAIVRSPTNPRARISCRPAWPRRISCAGCSSPKHSAAGYRCFSRHSRGRGPATAWLQPGDRDRPGRSEAGPSRWAEPQPRVDAGRDGARPASGRCADCGAALPPPNCTATRRCPPSPESITKAVIGWGPSPSISTSEAGLQ